MKLLMIVAVSIFLAGTAFAQKQPIEPIKVFVFTATTEGGFVDSDQKQRSDSLEDLKKSLGKDKYVQLVADKTSADIELEVIGRGLYPTGTIFSTTGTVEHNTTTSMTTTMMVVQVGLKAGSYSTTIQGRDSTDFKSWRDAAQDAVRQIDKWIKDNHEKLIARRSQQ